MGAIALTDAMAYVSGHDFSTNTNNIQFNASAAPLNATPFGTAWTTLVGGLKSIEFNMQGFWEGGSSAAPDPESFPALATVDEVFTVGATHTEAPAVASLTTAERAYMFRAAKLSYEMLGAVGEVAPFTLNSSGSNGVGAKQGLLLKKKASVSATGALGSTFDTLGFGVFPTQFIYATVHLFTVGTTITIQVQSDDNSGFSSPTTVATIGPLTTRGGTWMTPVPGQITDRYFRFNVSAITGTFSVGAAMAITT